MKLTDHDFLELMRRELDGDLDRIDTATTVRLAKIRREAILRCERRRGFISRFAPGFAFAASIIMLATFLYIPNGSTPQFEPDIPVFELVLAEGELELIEDLDFYRWLYAHGYAG